jgi:hypothetical protein
MGTSGVPLDKNLIIKGIYDKKGIIEHAAKSIGCDTTSIYAWMRKDEDVEFAVKDARQKADQERIDKREVLKQKAYASAEANLDQFDGTMTIFLLKTLCGFTENTREQSIVLNLVDRPYNEGEEKLSTMSLNDQELADPA